jgi:hypothetical protein
MAGRSGEAGTADLVPCASLTPPVAWVSRQAAERLYRCGAQACGSSVRAWTAAGSLPAAMWARVTVSRIDRSLARNAIQTSCSGFAAPW